MEELRINVQKLKVIQMYKFCIIVRQWFKGGGGFECKRARVSHKTCGRRFCSWWTSASCQSDKKSVTGMGVVGHNPAWMPHSPGAVRSWRNGRLQPVTFSLNWLNYQTKQDKTTCTNSVEPFKLHCGKCRISNNYRFSVTKEDWL